MPRPSDIDRQLAPCDRKAFLRYLDDPRCTIDDAHAWLHRREIKTGRSSVGRYRKNRSMAAAMYGIGGSAENLRNQIAGLASDLPASNLFTLAMIAAFLKTPMSARLSKSRAPARIMRDGEIALMN